MKGLINLEGKISYNSNINFSTIGTCLLLLCMFDALFTDIGIRNHLITEANPLMNWIYHNSILLFYALKISMPILLVWILRKVQPSLLIRILMICATSIYCAILFTHIWWITIAVS
ncbi:DUF5658 family protein [Rummeliibacillus sp. NPDC094406]|uniref:DUF5658 family protein n=1 Tax=Rummeliibacillus sp. NPDC094406 TaxID=3364511 RepID=UPI0037F14BAA